MIRAIAFALMLAGCATQLGTGDGGGPGKDQGVKDQGPPPDDLPGIVDLARSCVSSCNRCQGPCCGSLCCNPGEWCGSDGACHCGNGAGCTAPEICAAGGAVGFNACGTICCGGGGNPCPL
jgi:hypothetical protein